MYFNIFLFCFHSRSRPLIENYCSIRMYGKIADYMHFLLACNANIISNLGFVEHFDLQKARSSL